MRATEWFIYDDINSELVVKGQIMDYERLINNLEQSAEDRNTEAAMAIKKLLEENKKLKEELEKVEDASYEMMMGEDL
jgi:hypothetical protein